MSQRAPVQEVFSSYQGEGPYVGYRQLFVRFAHCHLKCAYCDTPMHTPSGQAFIEAAPASAQHWILENPLGVETLFDKIAPLLLSLPHHSISFTGGEPLLYHRYLAQLLPLLKQAFPQVKIYLETSGTQPDLLATVLPDVDIIAMDVKLPSSTQEPAQFDAHAAFYQLALQAPHRPHCFAKLVVNNHITQQELQETIRVLQGGTPQAPTLVIQPETALTNFLTEPLHVKANPETLLRIERCLRPYFADLRVIGQTHKLLQVR